MSSQPGSARSSAEGSRWFCHICHEEVRPLLTPDATCPQCRESFLEVIEEGAASDPRDFDAVEDDDGPMGFPPPLLGGPFFAGGGGPGQGAMQQLLGQFFNIAGMGAPPGQQQQPVDDPDDAHGGLFGAAEHGQAYGAHHREHAPPLQQNEVPVRNLADFLSSAFASPPREGQPNPQGQARSASEPGHGHQGRADSPTVQEQQQQAPMNPLMRLFSMLGAPLGGADGNGGFQFVFGGPGGGNFGDYATQQGFDDIITQLMEQAQGQYGPRPAPQEMIDELPKITMTKDLIEGPAVTGQECAICKDDFAEGDEASKLPCKHIMHTECVVPWLKQSGTCPVCRHELVEQPSSHAPRGPNAQQPDAPHPAFQDGGAMLHDTPRGGSPMPPPPGAGQMPGTFPGFPAFVRVFAGPIPHQHAPAPPQQQQQQQAPRRRSDEEEEDDPSMPPLERIEPDDLD